MSDIGSACISGSSSSAIDPGGEGQHAQALLPHLPVGRLDPARSGSIGDLARR